VSLTVKMRRHRLRIVPYSLDLEHLKRYIVFWSMKLATWFFLEATCGAEYYPSMHNYILH